MVDPTKVRIGERERDEDEPQLLETTIGRVVPLLPVAFDRSSGKLEASVDKLFDERGSAEQADQGDPASGGHVGEVMPTLSFVSSSVSTTMELEGRDHTELLAGANLQAKVDSIVRTFVPRMMSATTATPTADPAATVKETCCDFLVGGIRTVVDPDSNLQRFYVPQWNVTNGFCMDDGGVCQYNIKEKRRLKSRVEEKDSLLKSRCDEIKSLKAQLLIKESEAAEAFRLCDEAQALKDHNTNLEKEKSELKVKVIDLTALVTVREREVADLDVVVTSVKLQNDSLADQVHKLEAFAAGLQEKVIVYENCMSQLERFQDEKQRSDCKAIEKGMQEGLSAGITHGAGGRTLTDVAMYNPFAEADYLSALRRLQSVNFPLIAELKANKDASVEVIMNLFHLEDAFAEKLGLVESQPHVDQLMVPIHHSLDQHVIGASVLSLSLDVSSSRVQKIKENIANHVSDLRGVFVPLSEPLSIMALEGTEGTYGAAPDTTTALSVTFVSVSTILPISTDDYQIAHTEGEEGVGVDVEAVANEGADPFLDVNGAELDVPE
nr:nonaspanin [Tanacetum cinerariifolium]